MVTPQLVTPLLGSSVFMVDSLSLLAALNWVSLQLEIDRLIDPISCSSMLLFVDCLAASPIHESVLALKSSGR